MLAQHNACLSPPASCRYLSPPSLSLCLCPSSRHPSQTRAGGDRTPLPPCIRVGDSGNCEVTLELEDKQQHTMIGKITPEAVKVHIMGSAAHDSSQAEVLALMSKILTLRNHQLTLLRGDTPRSRVLVVEMLSARAVYARLRGIPMPQRRQDQPGFRKPKPWYHGL